MATAAPPRQPGVVARPTSRGRGGAQAGATESNRTPAKTGSTGRSAPTKLKTVIRRLPPGLTEDEFQRALGDEWRVGGDRVDWYAFRQGKVTKDISKPSIPGRAYLHLTKPDFTNQLIQSVRDSDFSDAKNTAGDSCLLGPPLMEMSTYSRIPATKPRKDLRQGTIDQDNEFMNFLLGLTDPITKPTPIDGPADKENIKPEEFVTPLIQYLRDKKANKDKAKDQPQPKPSKQSRQDGKDPKTSPEKVSGSKSKANKDAASASNNDKKAAATSKADRASREPVKVLSKPPASQKNSQAQTAHAPKPQSATSEPTIAAAPTPSKPPPERKQRKVGAEAKSLLQRDLGLGNGGRRKRGEPNSTNEASPATPAKSAARRQSVNASSGQNSTTPPATETTTPTVPSVIQAPPTSGAKNTAKTLPSTAKETPNTNKNNKEAGNSSKVGKSNQGKSSTPTTNQGSPANTCAFLKHVNASQGITEPLIQASMATFGTVNRVEVDKKKGFAYVEFASAEILKKAMEASPVKIGQGSVTVLEKREKAAKSDKSSKGGGGGGNSNSAAAAQTTASLAASGEKAATSVSQSQTAGSAAGAAAGNTTASPNRGGATVSGSGGGGNASGGGRQNNSKNNSRPRGNRGRGAGRSGGGGGGVGGSAGGNAAAVTSNNGGGGGGAAVLVAAGGSGGGGGSGGKAANSQSAAAPTQGGKL